MRSLNSLANSRFGTHLTDAIAWIIFLLKHAGWQLLVLAFMILFRPEISNFIYPPQKHQVVAPQTIYAELSNSSCQRQTKWDVLACPKGTEGQQLKTILRDENCQLTETIDSSQCLSPQKK